MRLLALAIVLCASCQAIETSGLSPAKAEKVEAIFRRADLLAEAFAGKEGLEATRRTMPGRVELHGSTKKMAQALGLPEEDRLGHVVARMDMRLGVVHLSRWSEEDVYVELGKWLFYPTSHKWGKDLKEDKRLLAIAERFAQFCMRGGK